VAPDDRGEAPLRVERTFSAPIDAVFDAWLQVEVLRRWWPAGRGWTTPVAELDPRVGGVLRLVMRDPGGAEFGGHGTFVEIARPRRLVFTWTWDDDGQDARAQIVEVDLSDPGDGTTQVVLTNRGLDDDAKEGHREGWQASFDNLDEVLAS
jgi:uncharacterized protein YndB with AHSA1/START domain